MERMSFTIKVYNNVKSNAVIKASTAKQSINLKINEDDNAPAESNIRMTIHEARRLRDSLNALIKNFEN